MRRSLLHLNKVHLVPAAMSHGGIMGTRDIKKKLLLTVQFPKAYIAVLLPLPVLPHVDDFTQGVAFRFQPLALSGVETDSV